MIRKEQRRCGVLGWIVAMCVMGAGMSYGDASPALKIGFVDLSVLFFQSDYGKAQVKKFEEEARKKEKVLLPKEESLKTRMENFKKQEQFLSEKSVKENKFEMERQFKTFQGEVMMIRSELAKTEQLYTKEVVKYIFEVVKDVGASEKYDYVMEKQSLLFGGTDLTDKVLKSMNEKFKKQKK